MRTVALLALLCAACTRVPEPEHHYAASPSVGPSLGEAGAVTLDAGVAEASAPTYYVYPSVAAAVSAAAAVDRALGYPSRGIDVGGGIHVGPDAGWTTTYATPIVSADGGAYAYPSDSVTAAVLADAAPSPVAITMLDGGKFVATAIP